MTTRDLVTTEQLIAGPLLEPVALATAKLHTRVTGTSEDALITSHIAAARGLIEENTGRQLLGATWEYRLEAFPTDLTDRPFPVGMIELPHPPLLQVLSVAIGPEGSPEQTLIEGVDYEVERPVGPYAARGMIRPIGSWPSVTPALGAVRIRFRAGYGEDAEDVPSLLTGALLFLVGHFYQFRSEVYEGAPGTSITSLPLGADAILRAFKYSALPTQPQLRTTWAA